MADDGSSTASAASLAAPAHRDLFVSYATGDAGEIAENIVIDLERRGLRCWVAPRDIPAGAKSWAAEIVRAIRDCDNFVLLLSEAANASDEIEKELSEAARHRKTVFVIRVADIEPSDGLGYHLNRVQWRDLFRNRETVLNEIAGRVLVLREATLAARAARPVGPISAAQDFHAHTQPMHAPAPSVQPKQTGLPFGLILGALGVLAVAAIGGWLALRPLPPPASIAAVAPPPSLPAAATAPVSAPAPAAPAEPVQAAKPSDAPDLQIETPPGLDPQQFRNVYLALSEIAPRSRALTRQAELYLRGPGNKALAGAPPTTTFRRTGLAARDVALRVAVEGCAVMLGAICRPVMANDALVPAAEAERIVARAAARMLYAGRFDPEQVPALTDNMRGRLEVAGYAAAGGPKAAAIHPATGLFVTLGAASQFAAEQKALAECEAEARKQTDQLGCLLYAAGDAVVLPQRLSSPMAAPPVETAAQTPPAPNGPAANAPVPQRPQEALRDAVAAALRQVVPSYRFTEIQADRYVADRKHRALVFQAPDRAWRWTGAPTPEGAVGGALEGCALLHGSACDVLFVDDARRSTADFEPVRAKSGARLAYAGNFDPAMIPTVYRGYRERPDIVGYGRINAPKAMAINPFGRLFIQTDAVSQIEAERRALAACNENAQTMDQRPRCLLYASGNVVVLPQRLYAPLSRP